MSIKANHSVIYVMCARMNRSALLNIHIGMHNITGKQSWSLLYVC